MKTTFAVLRMQTPLSFKSLRPVLEDVVQAPLLKLAVDDEVVEAAGVRPDHAAAGRLKHKPAGIFGRLGTVEVACLVKNPPVSRLEDAARQPWPSPYASARARRATSARRRRFFSSRCASPSVEA